MLYASYDGISPALSNKSTARPPRMVMKAMNPEPRPIAARVGLNPGLPPRNAPTIEPISAQEIIVSKSRKSERVWRIPHLLVSHQPIDSLSLFGLSHL